MLGVVRRGYRGDGNGHSWVHSPSGVATVEDVYGPRRFAAHIPTVGYDYDLHKGIDIPFSAGATEYSMLSGAVIRVHYTHFGWESASQLDQWTLVTPSSSLSVAHVTDHLALTCSRVGAVTFPANVDKYQPIKQRVSPKDDNDWCIEINLTSTISTTGAIGIGIFNAANTEYVSLEYDGTTFTTRGVGTTTFTNNGATFASSGSTWLRVTYTSSTDTFAWLRSTNGTTFTTIASESGRSFASILATHIPTLYWRSADTNATPYTIGIAKLNWYDLTQQTSRFGNYVVVADATHKMHIQHMQSPLARQGQFIHVGQQIGLAGMTGFDARSGRVNHNHAHVEVAATNVYDYAVSPSINPLSVLYLPRVNVSNNVSVIRTRENDPDGLDSWKLVINVTRADQDLDLNSVTLVGNTTSRTINLNTKAGLNADLDIPKQSGVYIVASNFDSSATIYTMTVYFNTATVGSTFVSYSVADTEGVVLASE